MRTWICALAMAMLGGCAAEAYYPGGPDGYAAGYDDYPYYGDYGYYGPDVYVGGRLHGDRDHFHGDHFRHAPPARLGRAAPAFHGGNRGSAVHGGGGFHGGSAGGSHGGGGGGGGGGGHSGGGGHH